MVQAPGMELTILGSGTAVPSLRRSPPGHLLRIGEDRVVFDTGCGTMGRLLKAGVAHGEVTHLFYSHNHLDHTGELASWLFTSRIVASARTAPLVIGGSAGFMRMLGGLKDVFGPWLDAATYRLDLVTLGAAEPAPRPFSAWSLRAFPVSHIESSLSYRVTGPGGKTFAFTGDTDLCDELVDLARDADLLLIEASSPDGQKIPGHLTPSEAGEVARRAGARKVVLTHFYPACDQVDMLGPLRRAYDGEALLAEDGMRLTL